MNRCQKSRCAGIERDPEETRIKLAPVTLRFHDGLSVTIETRYHFPGHGHILIERIITDISDPAAAVTLEEYVKASYGITEYPQDMRGIELSVAGETSQTLTYAYGGRCLCAPLARSLKARIPAIHAELRLEAVDDPAEAGLVTEGFLFNPYFTFQLRRTMRKNRRMITRLLINSL